MFFRLSFCLHLASRSFFEHKLSECILGINSQANMAAVGWCSTLPKTSGNQRGCGKNRSEINRAGASESPLLTLLPNLSFLSTLPLWVAESRVHLRRNEKAVRGGSKACWGNSLQQPVSRYCSVSACDPFFRNLQKHFNDSRRPACALVSDRLAAVEGTRSILPFSPL